MRPKPKLDAQLFIYFAATNEQFRKKYFSKPDALTKDYDISKQALATINGIDFGKLKTELSLVDAKLGKLDSKVASCHDSHSYHDSGTHSSGTHNNNCSQRVRTMLDQVLTRIR